MNVGTIDLNLLRVFAAVYAERSVSRGAAALGLSQPAVSNALARLRRTCADPLFTRAAAGMEPTPMAQEMILPVRQALTLLQDCLQRPQGFAPRTSSRRFRLLMSDAGELVVLPPLMAFLRTEAPGLTVETQRLPHDRYKEALQTGGADLAVGNLPFLGGGFYRQSLFRDPYRCIARAGHPLVGPGLGLRRYLAAEHVKVDGGGNAEEVIDRELGRRRSQRAVRLRVGHYHVALAVVRATDLIAAVPGNAVAHAQGLQVLDLPFAVRPADVRQFWHRRVHHDPAHRWLRAVLAGLRIGPAAAA